jgi:hypothetical protein
VNLQLKQSTIQTIPVVCPYDWRPTAVAAAFYDPSGTAVDTTLVTVLGRQKVLASGTYGAGQSDPTLLTLADGDQAETDFYRGDQIVIGDQDYAEAQDLERAIVASYVYQAGDTQAIYTQRDLTHTYTGAGDVWVWTCKHWVSFTAADTATLDRNYQLILTWTHPNTSTVTSEERVDVVYHPYQRTLSEVELRQRWPEIARDAHNFNTHAGGTLNEMMDVCWLDVLEEIQSSGYKPDLIRDHHQLETPTAVAIRLRLAKNGIAPSGFRGDMGSYVESCQYDFHRAIKQMMSNLTFYDENDDGNVDDGEEDRAAGNIWLRR